MEWRVYCIYDEAIKADEKGEEMGSGEKAQGVMVMALELVPAVFEG